MKCVRITFVVLSLFVIAGCATQLEMNPPPTLDVEDIKQHPYAVGLYIPMGLKERVFSVNTSPFDVLTYPIGQQTALAFQKNTPLVFKKVIDVDSRNPPQKVKFILQPSIVKFSPTIPHPAYNPYMATVVYKIDVFDRSGKKVYTQTAAGEAQTSKGLLSGFSALGLLAEAAQMAMDKAMKQILEGLATAEELKALK
jgi:hypothetical protein